MDVDESCERASLQGAPPQAVILLDTIALIWLQRSHRRARPLGRFPRLYVSPASLLELQFLAESGRVRFEAGASV